MKCVYCHCPVQVYDALCMLAGGDNNCCVLLFQWSPSQMISSFPLISGKECSRRWESFITDKFSLFSVVKFFFLLQWGWLLQCHFYVQVTSASGNVHVDDQWWEGSMSECNAVVVMWLMTSSLLSEGDQVRWAQGLTTEGISLHCCSFTHHAMCLHKKIKQFASYFDFGLCKI